MPLLQTKDGVDQLANVIGTSRTVQENKQSEELIKQGLNSVRQNGVKNFNGVKKRDIKLSQSSSVEKGAIKAPSKNSPR